MVASVFDCATGEVVIRPLTAAEAAELQATQAVEAAAVSALAAARRAKVAAAEAVIASNPDYKTILDALGITI